MQIKTIGSITCEGRQMVITVEKKYQKALHYVEEFSHIHVFYVGSVRRENYLGRCVAEVIRIENNVLEVRSADEISGDANLIDIKPYFPSEDRVNQETLHEEEMRNEKVGKQEQKEKSIDVMIPGAIAKVQDVDQEKYIVGEIEKKDTGKNEIEKNETEKKTPGGEYQLEPIGVIRNKNGQCYIKLQNDMSCDAKFITVFWWFDRFDHKNYRSVCECNPPYENAPKTGVFATRSPVRPNPIAMTVVKVLEVDYNSQRIYLSDIESFDGTPCIGFQEYFFEKYSIAACQVPDWLKHWPKYIKFADSKEEKADCFKENCNTQLSDWIREVNRDNEKEMVIDNKGTQIKGQMNSYENDEMAEMKTPHEIVVRGARENNLQGIHVRIPYGKITAVVGVSGSGKSSLVHDTIYAECRRRMEYLSPHPKALSKPKVDEMIGCIPTVAITQDAIRGNLLSTIGTYCDAYDGLRNLYATIGIRRCPSCGQETIPLTKEQILSLLKKHQPLKIRNLSKQPMEEDTLEWMVNVALQQGDCAFYADYGKGNVILLQTKQKCYRCDRILFEMTPAIFSYMDPDSRCPVCHGTGQRRVVDEKKLIEHPEKSLLDGASSFYGKLGTFLEHPNANWMKGQVFGLAASLQVDLSKPWNELPKEFCMALLHGTEREVTFTYDNKKNGRKGEITRPVEGMVSLITRLKEDHETSVVMDRYLTTCVCDACEGERLNMEGRMVRIGQYRYPEVAKMNFFELKDFCNGLRETLTESELTKAAYSISSLMETADTAIRLGIGYLPLSRETNAVSGGEGQRLKLLGAFRNHISGILYLFDEPSKGLHPKDYGKVIELLHALVQEGNTILMVEHNEEMIAIADHVIEIGPGAGAMGGGLVGEGSLEAMLEHKGTQMHQYRNDDCEKIIKKRVITDVWEKVRLSHLCSNNLKDISVAIPLHAMTCICGVSGSGKSTLLKKELAVRLTQDKTFADVILADQLPIGKNSKSVVATYIGCMDAIRSIFAATPFAVQRKWQENMFSFNSTDGQCPTCKGDGRVKVPFTEDFMVLCPDCKGRRYRKEVLEVSVKERNIAQVLELSVTEAIPFFADACEVTDKIQVLEKVGLGYLKLGQGTATLSGGEASRLKLAKELMTKHKRGVLYLLDEPTTGLHFSDIQHLLSLMEELIVGGNTVVAIEHNKQFLRACDWRIEMGPGAGENGGEVINIGKCK